MGKLVSCRSCGAEIAKSAKTCPQCGAKNKNPFYKRWWFWVLVVIVFLSGVGSQSSGQNTESVADKVSEEYKNLTPEEKAEETYLMVSTAIRFAEDRMNELSDYMTGLDETYTVQDLYNYSVRGIENCQTYRTHLDEVPDLDNSEGYRDAAYNYIVNVEAAHIKMRDYLETADQNDLDYVSGCFKNQNAVTVAFVAAQQKYLMDAGFSLDEIDELLDR